MQINEVRAEFCNVALVSSFAGDEENLIDTHPFSPPGGSVAPSPMTSIEFGPKSELQPAVHPAVHRQRYDRVAPFYDLLDLPFEYGRYRALRPHLFQSISGTILDAGVGTGRNMPFYPEGSHITGIDLSPAMIARASKRRAKLGKDVELLEMSVLATTFPDRHFDSIVATFLFCVLDVDQQLPALRELARICKPTGVLRFLEYTYSNDPIRHFMMRLWAPWVRWMYGAAFDRQTERHIPQAGLEVVETRFLFKDTIKLIVARPASA
jgi:ubiquinone/menaquinone biosynthesis C-methylase UbiE